MSIVASTASTTSSHAADAAIRAIAQPDALCPCCWQEEQAQHPDRPVAFPRYATTRHCAHHASAMRALYAARGQEVR